MLLLSVPQLTAHLPTLLLVIAVAMTTWWFLLLLLLCCCILYPVCHCLFDCFCQCHLIAGFGLSSFCHCHWLLAVQSQCFHCNFLTHMSAYCHRLIVLFSFESSSYGQHLVITARWLVCFLSLWFSTLRCWHHIHFCLSPLSPQCQLNNLQVDCQCRFHLFCCHSNCDYVQCCANTTEMHQSLPFLKPPLSCSFSWSSYCWQ